MDMIGQALQLMESNQIEEAVELVDHHLPYAHNDDKYTIAELYLQWGFYQKAQPILEDLLRLYPDESELKTTLADIYIELENDEAAIQILNEIDETDPAYVQALMQLADLYEAQGLFEVTEVKLMTAKQHMPEEPIIDFALGELLFSLGDYSRAITYYERIASKMTEVAEASIQERLAEAYAAIGQYEMALTFYETINKEDPDTLFKYGLTAYYANRKDIAIHKWKQLIEKDKFYHSVYYYLAKAYKEEELLEEAYATSQKGLTFDEFNKELYYLSSVLARQLRKDKKSEELVREAIILDPEYKKATLFLIEQLKENERHREVIDLLKEIKNLSAHDPLYEWELARAYEALECFNDALKYYNHAYTHLKHDSDFLKEYAYFLVEEGKIEDGIDVFSLYLRKEPLDYDVEEYIGRLKQIGDNG